MNKVEFQEVFDRVSNEQFVKFGAFLKEEASKTQGGKLSGEELSAYIITNTMHFTRDYVQALLLQFLPLDQQ